MATASENSVTPNCSFSRLSFTASVSFLSNTASLERSFSFSISEWLGWSRIRALYNIQKQVFPRVDKKLNCEILKQWVSLIPDFRESDPSHLIWLPLTLVRRFSVYYPIRSPKGITDMIEISKTETVMPPYLSKALHIQQRP